jgi:hypothetical protein
VFGFQLKNSRYNQRHQNQIFNNLLPHFLLYLAIYVKGIYPVIKFFTGVAGDEGTVDRAGGFLYYLCRQKKGFPWKGSGIR